MSKQNFLIGGIFQLIGVLSFLSPIFYYIGFSKHEKTKRLALRGTLAIYIGLVIAIVGYAMMYISYYILSNAVYYSGIVIIVIGFLMPSYGFFEYYKASKEISTGIIPTLILLGAIAPAFVLIGMLSLGIIYVYPQYYGLLVVLEILSFGIAGIMNLLSAVGFILLATSE